MNDGCEIELGNEKRKFFIKVVFEPFEIWIDFRGIPKTAFLCAMFDSIPMIRAKCGEEKDEERFFAKIDWFIDEWGGDKEIIEAMKTRKQMIIDDLPNLKEKYMVKNDPS